MPHCDHARRTAVKRAGDQRGAAVARRIGIGIRESRIALRLTQAEAGDRAGVSQSAWSRAEISQSAWSRIERGKAAAASLETLAACAAAVDSQLAGFVEARPGATLPRDIEHLRRQELLISIARAGGWSARPERPIDPAATRSRSIDVDLVRKADAEEVVVEIEDLILDGGAVIRNLSDKIAAVRRAAPAGAAVRGLLIVRATRRNRQTLGAFPALFGSRFPGSGRTWLKVLSDPTAPLPADDGLLWSSASGDRLMVVRLSGLTGTGVVTG